MTPLRLAITTLGCKVNRCDADLLMARLREFAVEVPFKEKADLYIINSCTVTGAADRQSRQMIYRARRLNPEAKVVLTGCMPTVDMRGSKRIPGVDQIFAVNHHERLVAFIQKLAGGEPDQPLKPLMTADVNWRARPFLKVQDGCGNACSYCIVPRARGFSHSVLTPVGVRKKLQSLAQQGFCEVVLTGIRLGQYGKDLQPQTSLVELLSFCMDAIPRIRLSSLEPQEVIPALMDLMVSAPSKICNHLHIPVQSGNDQILKAMNRPYEAKRIWQLFEELKKKLPDMALGTDLIVGFPGETDQQFESSLQLVEQSPLTHLHVFSFSPRPATPAAGLANPVPDEVKQHRVALLRDAGQQKMELFAGTQVGKVRHVLVEKQRRKDGLLTGLTENYLRVVFEGKSGWVGKLVPVRLHSAHRIEGQNGVVLKGSLASR